MFINQLSAQNIGATSTSKLIAPKVLYGLYSDGDKNNYIELTESNFLFYCKLRGRAGYEGVNDTIIRGTWRINDRNYIEVSSIEKRDRFPVLEYNRDFEVRKSKGLSNDSVYFYLDCPIRNKGIVWSVWVVGFDPNAKVTNKECIVVPKSCIYESLFYKHDGRWGFIFSLSPNLIEGDWFTIPTSSSPKMNIFTFFCNSSTIMLEKCDSNVIHINAKMVTKQFIREKIVVEDYIKVMDWEHLKWDGVVFRKIE